MSMGTFHVAQTFLSAVPQVFQPARRVGKSNGCLATDALPDRKGLNIQYPTRNFQGGRKDSIFCKSTPSLEIGHSLLDIGYFPIPHSPIPIPHFPRELRKN